MAGCCSCQETQAKSRKFRNALWIALFLNFTMFIVEVTGEHIQVPLHSGLMHWILQEILSIT